MSQSQGKQWQRKYYKTYCLLDVIWNASRTGTLCGEHKLDAERISLRGFTFNSGTKGKNEQSNAVNASMAQGSALAPCLTSPKCPWAWQGWGWNTGDVFTRLWNEERLEGRTEAFIKGIASFFHGITVREGRERTEPKEDTLAGNQVNLKLKCGIGCWHCSQVWTFKKKSPENSTWDEQTQIWSALMWHHLSVKLVDN